MNEILQDISNSVKATLYDRLGDPFFRSFISLFLIKNWRSFFVLAFDSAKPADRIRFVNDNFQFPFVFDLSLSPLHFDLAAFLTSISANFGVPFLFALFYVFFYPFIKEAIIEWSEARKADIQNARNLASQARLLTFKEGIALREQLRIAEDQLRSSVASVPSYEQLTTLGQYALAAEYGNYGPDYRIVRASPLDVDRIKPGMWVLLSSGASVCELMTSPREIDPLQKFGLVIRVIDSQFIALAINGDYDLRTRQELRFDDYQAGSTYVVSLTRPGIPELLKHQDPTRPTEGWRIIFSVPATANSIHITGLQSQVNGFRVNT